MDKQSINCRRGLLMKKVLLLPLLIFTLIEAHNNSLEQQNNSIIYAPWCDKKKDPDPLSKQPCAFCRCIKQNNDKQELILKRYKHFFVVLSLFPCTKGHLLIIPYRHVKQLSGLLDEERSALINLTSESIDILNQALKPDGINVGINLGKAAGASIPDHLHIHVVPRYNKNTTSFIGIIAEARFIGFDMNCLYEKLQPHFK